MSRTNRRIADLKRRAEYLSARITEAEMVADGIAAVSSTPKCGWERAAIKWYNERDAINCGIKCIKIVYGKKHKSTDINSKTQKRKN
jgi:hypothetical protein